MKKVLALLVVALLCFALTACGNGKTYEEAIAAKESGDYEAALELFQSIEDYKDSGEQIQSINDTLTEMENQSIYNEALAAQEEYDYDRAIELLNKIAGFKDSDALLKTAEEEAFQEEMATYIFNMIREGGFYNPSAVRILHGGYNTPENGDKYAEVFKVDGILYITVQGTNKMGGTINKDRVILIGGENDGKPYDNDDPGNDYSICEKELDIGFVNKMLAHYWEELGIA